VPLVGGPQVAHVTGSDELDAGVAGESRRMDDRDDGMLAEVGRARAPHHLQQLALPAAEGMARIVRDVESLLNGKPSRSLVDRK